MLKMIFQIILFIFLVSLGFLFLGFPKEKEDISWGVNFSSKHAREMGIDQEDIYLSILDDLKADNIKIAVHWDEIEKEEGIYSFENIDFMVDEAQKRNVKIILVIGMKTSRWPECHIPSWAKEIGKENQQERILNQIEKIVLRYKDREVIKSFQVENEPFFEFGDCPWRDDDFVKEEVKLVKSISDKPIIISDTGEFSFWFKAGKIGDIVGVTMYRKAWFKEINRYVSYPFPATFYKRKANLINWFLNKEVVGIELQAEPWGPSLLYNSPIEEQMKSMDINQFRKNIIFAKKVGFKENYLWGVEWWYFMKEKNDNSSFWEEAKKIWK